MIIYVSDYFSDFIPHKASALRNPGENHPAVAFLVAILSLCLFVRGHKASKGAVRIAAKGAAAYSAKTASLRLLDM